MSLFMVIPVAVVAVEIFVPPAISIVVALVTVRLDPESPCKTQFDIDPPPPVAAIVTVPPLFVVVIPEPAAIVIVPLFDIVELPPEVPATDIPLKGSELVTVTVLELSAVVIPVPPAISTVCKLVT